MVLTVYVWTYETLILVLPFELGCIISFYRGTRGSEEMIGSYRETIKDYWAFIKKEWTVGQATLTLEGLFHRQMWIILTIHNSLLLMRVLMTMTIWLIAALLLFRAHYGPSPTINALCVPSQLILMSVKYMSGSVLQIICALDKSDHLPKVTQWVTAEKELEPRPPRFQISSQSESCFQEVFVGIRTCTCSPQSPCRVILGDGSRVTSVSASPIGSGKDAFVSKLGELFLWLSAYSRAPQSHKVHGFPSL